MATQDPGSIVLTVGHSTRPLADFIDLLKAHGVVRLIDVRTVPRSRHNPQYNIDTLPVALVSEGIGYEHVAGLGGFRKTHPGSANTGWRNTSFRGYADYMQTPRFEEHLAHVIAAARARAHCPDVRGSCAVALSSLTYRRCAGRARPARRGDRQPEPSPDTCVDAVCHRKRCGHYISTRCSDRAKCSLKTTRLRDERRE